MKNWQRRKNRETCSCPHREGVWEALSPPMYPLSDLLPTLPLNSSSLNLFFLSWCECCQTLSSLNFIYSRLGKGWIPLKWNYLTNLVNKNKQNKISEDTFTNNLQKKTKTLITDTGSSKKKKQRKNRSENELFSKMECLWLWRMPWLIFSNDCLITQRSRMSPCLPDRSLCPAIS